MCIIVTILTQIILPDSVSLSVDGISVNTGRMLMRPTI